MADNVQELIALARGVPDLGITVAQVDVVPTLHKLADAVERRSSRWSPPSWVRHRSERKLIEDVQKLEGSKLNLGGVDVIPLMKALVAEIERLSS